MQRATSGFNQKELEKQAQEQEKVLKKLKENALKEQLLKRKSNFEKAH